MNTTVNLQVVIVAILGSGIVGACLSYITARRANRTTYMESVAETLSEFNDRLKSELKDVREELDQERKLRRQEVDQERKLRRQEVGELTEALRAEKKKTRELETRISQLERGE